MTYFQEFRDAATQVENLTLSVQEEADGLSDVEDYLIHKSAAIKLTNEFKALSKTLFAVHESLQKCNEEMNAVHEKNSNLVKKKRLEWLEEC